MIHIPLILAAKAARVVYRNRELIADGVRALQSDAGQPAGTENADHLQADAITPSEAEELPDAQVDSVAQLEADARAEHLANMRSLAAGMKAWAMTPRTW